MSKNSVCNYDKRMQYPNNIAVLLGLVALVVITTTSYLNILTPDIMEGRNFIAAQEIVNTGNWLIPSLFGELRIAKPPLPTWLTSVAMLLGGTEVSLIVNRIPSALGGIFLAISFFGLTRTITRSFRVSVLSTAVLSTSYMFAFMAHRGTWDIHAVAFMTAMLWAVAELLNGQKFRPGLCLVAGCMFGFSFLSKGPVAFYALLLPYCFAECATYGISRFRENRKNILLLTIVGIAISASWYVVIWLAHPAALLDMISQESTAWGSRHIQPFWFYLVQFPFMVGIWGIFATITLYPKYAAKRLARVIPYKKVLLWTLAIVVLLSVIPEKKDRYLLPVVIPLSILVGGYLEYIIRTGFSVLSSKRLLKVHTLLFILLLFCSIGLVVGNILLVPASFDSIMMNLIIIALCFVQIFLLCRLLSKQRTRLLIASFFTSLVLLLMTAPPLVQQLLPSRGTIPIAEIREFVGNSQDRVFTLVSLRLQAQWVIGKPAELIRADALHSLPAGRSVIVAGTPLRSCECFEVTGEYVAKNIKRNPLYFYSVQRN